jgi:nucleoid-associated protein YgaU
MPRLMYDAVTAHQVPADATLIAGYVNGRYANMVAMRARFPHALLVGISVSAHADAGTVLDVERGDATPAEAPGWVTMRRHAGVDPTVYCSASVLAEVVAAFRHAGVAQPHYWIAKWDGSSVIPPGAVAKQFHNYPAYDISSVAAHWPGVDPTVPPGHVHTYTVKPDDNLTTIALHHGVTLAALEHANPQIKNPNLIFPGQVLHIP